MVNLSGWLYQVSEGGREGVRDVKKERGREGGREAEGLRWKYGMGHKKVPVFCKTTTVQRKFCVPFPCPFRSTYYRVYFCCVGKIILSTWNGEQTVEKNGEKNVVSM